MSLSHAALQSAIAAMGPPSEARLSFDPARSSGSRMFVLGDQVTGADNQRLVLDMTGHVASQFAGYMHPKLTSPAALQELGLAASARYASGDFGTPYRARLAPVFRRTVMRDRFTHSILFMEGARAVEAAGKIAFYARQGEADVDLNDEGVWLTPSRGFHGRSVFALSLTQSFDPRKHENMPRMRGIERISCPTATESEDASKLRERDDAALAELRARLTVLGPRFIGFVMEPMPGEGGYLFYSQYFMQKLEALVREFGGVFIIDEIQTAFAGGRVFLHEHYGVTPDLVTFGKKFGCSGVLAGAEFTARYPRHPLAVSESRESSTWSGDPAADVRLRLFLELLEEENLLQHAEEVGGFLRAAIRKLAGEHNALRNVRGLGLLNAVDLPDAKFRDTLVDECLRQDLLVLGCGRQSLRFCPALTVTHDEATEAADRLSRALQALAAVR